MKPTKLEWEDVIQFEEIEGYGKSIWNSVNILDTALIAMKMNYQSILTRSSMGREEPLLDDQIYFHYQNVQVKLKITK